MTDDIDIGETEKLYLPWHHNDNGLITGTSEDPESEDYPHIADLAQEPGMEGSGDRFRAEFIVLACNAHNDFLTALEDLLGDKPDVQGGICQHCGRDYLGSGHDDMLTGNCPADDCPAYGARAAIAKARGQQ